MTDIPTFIVSRQARKGCQNKFYHEVTRERATKLATSYKELTPDPSLSDLEYIRLVYGHNANACSVVPSNAFSFECTPVSHVFINPSH